MGIDRLLCSTLNTNDSLKQFLWQIFPKIQFNEFFKKFIH